MPRKASVLIVDDEEKLRHYLKKELVRKGYEVSDAGEGKGALDSLARQSSDVVLLDIALPGENGVAVLEKIRKEHPLARVIMLTGNATVETALESMKLGAYDYLTKPYDLGELCLLVDRAFAETQLRREHEVLQRRFSRESEFDLFVGEDPGVQEALRMAERAATASSSVLISGETGTGKEIIARMIHQKSVRRDEPFLALNCAAFQDALLESELFGHEKGAFTDASRQKPGLVELASRGSLFLDEIGDMPPGVQAKVLRFLDSGEFRRLGGTRNMKTDIRILSATHRDLPKAIREGKFRDDLFFRLNVVTIRLPPLRERRGDIPRLAEHFLKKCAATIVTRSRSLSPEALAILTDYPWPGNVRELENIVERAMILSEGEVIRGADIASCLKGGSPSGNRPKDSSLAEVERCHILKVLAATGANKTQAARSLGIDVKTLYNKLRDYEAAS
ncbi:MAG: sigma-54-dependent Fis family transcriptional regulator [Elusimicrobia bacterium]|nr:sigma-54-dependent Fis family transcriptional regulator [Elusimicrobiota bacterium]